MSSIWFPLVLIGGILTIVIGSLRPVVRKRFQEVEERKWKPPHSGALEQQAIQRGPAAVALL